jgi:hypothetical protein
MERRQNKLINNRSELGAGITGDTIDSRKTDPALMTESIHKKSREAPQSLSVSSKQTRILDHIKLDSSTQQAEVFQYSPGSLRTNLWEGEQ